MSKTTKGELVNLFKEMTTSVKLCTDDTYDREKHEFAYEHYFLQRNRNNVPSTYDIGLQYKNTGMTYPFGEHHMNAKEMKMFLKGMLTASSVIKR